MGCHPLRGFMTNSVVAIVGQEAGPFKTGLWIEFQIQPPVAALNNGGNPLVVKYFIVRGIVQEVMAIHYFGEFLLEN